MPDRIGQILVRKKIISQIDLDTAIERQNREPHKYLGQILCEMGLPQTKIIRGIYASNKRKKLGQVLLDFKMISSGQLVDALLEQQMLKNKGIYMRLGALLAERRIISEKDRVDALSAHFSMPVVSLENYQASMALQKLIGETYASQNRIVVLRNSPQQLTVAVAEPDAIIFEQLEKLMPKGKSILFCLAKAPEIETCLDKEYDRYRNQRIKYQGSRSLSPISNLNHKT